MIKKLLLVLVCLALATPAYAYRVDNTIINNVDGTRPIQVGVPTGISSDRVYIDTHEAKVLGNSTDIYAVLLRYHPSNNEPVFISSPNNVTGMQITGDTIRINTDNLDDIYITGNDLTDSVDFVIELR